MRSTGGRQLGGLPIFLIKVSDLGFFVCEDRDLPEAGPHCFGRSGEFQNAPPANVIVHLCQMAELIHSDEKFLLQADQR
jgi:hypothetical protein